MINLNFNDMEEMFSFARAILAGGDAAGEGQKERPQPVIPVGLGQAAAPIPTAAVPVDIPGPAAPVQPVISAPTSAPDIRSGSVAAAVPTSEPTYTLDDLARASMGLMDSGRQAELMKLLTQFGVEALPALPTSQYGAFATALRGLGAQI